jgi:hypothetical protein
MIGVPVGRYLAGFDLLLALARVAGGFSSALQSSRKAWMRKDNDGM